MADSTASQSTGGRYSIQRTVPRYSFMAVAQIETPADACIVGRVFEISRKGCYVDIPNSFPVGTPLQVMLSRDGGSFATQGRVIYAQATGMGIAFVDPTDEQLAVLDSWLAEREVVQTPRRPSEE